MKAKLALFFLILSTAANAEQIGLKCNLPGTSLDVEWHILVDTTRRVYSARLEKNAVFKRDEPAEINRDIIDLPPTPGGVMRLAIDFGARKHWLIIMPNDIAYTSGRDGSMMMKAGSCEHESATVF